MTDTNIEREFLRNVVTELEEDGYEVFLQPQPPILPPFLRDFRPDAIARRNNKHLVVEIVTTLGERSKTLAAMASAVRANPDWEMRIVVVSPTNGLKPLQRQSENAIKQSVDEMTTLIGNDHYRAALLMGWSTFEALGRTIMPTDFARPQSPGRLVQLLAQEGYVTPSEADTLRKLGDKRNVLIHGNVLTEVSKGEVEAFAMILLKLIELQSTVA
jgi:uncharacterized protein YutE (UPF0331/DUF86 family)